MIRPFYERWADAVLGLVNTAAKLRRFDDAVKFADAEFEAVTAKPDATAADIVAAMAKFKKIGEKAGKYGADAKAHGWPDLLLHQQHAFGIRKLSSLAENSPGFGKSVLERGLAAMGTKEGLPPVSTIKTQLAWQKFRDIPKREQILQHIIQPPAEAESPDAKEVPKAPNVQYLLWMAELVQDSAGYVDANTSKTIATVAWERLRAGLPVQDGKKSLPLSYDSRRALIGKILLAEPEIKDYEAHIANLKSGQEPNLDLGYVLPGLFKEAIQHDTNTDGKGGPDAAKRIATCAKKYGVALIQDNKNMLRYLETARSRVRAAIDTDLRDPKSRIVAANVDDSWDIPTLQGIVDTEEAFKNIRSRALNYVLHAGESEKSNLALDRAFRGHDRVSNDELRLFFSAPPSRRDKWSKDLQASITQQNGSLDKFSQVMTALAARYDATTGNGQSASIVAVVQDPPAIDPAAPSAPAQIENGDGGNATPAVVTKPTIRLVVLPDGTMGLPQRERAQ
jgi:hypothetical protein